MSRTRIKFCGLVRAEDVRHAASLGVDAIGLVFYDKSPRYLNIDDAVALRRSIPSYVSCVGLFVNASSQFVAEHQVRLGLDVLQFHGDETQVQIENMRQECQKQGVAKDDRLAWKVPFWKALRVRPESDLLEYASRYEAAEALLLDAFSDAYGGMGKRFDWALAKPLAPSRMILAAGLDAGTVGQGIEALRPLAVDVSSGIQGEHARLKSASKMEQFVAAVQAADSRKARNEAL